ncbi:hypothetical protein K9M41_04290 [Candidatus Gracilibacteria bacterium]|nr:hypothetical protein [Candidatus Gracilibacteria bacterium]
MQVYFLGPEKTYSYAIADKSFPHHELVPQSNFFDVVRSTLKNTNSVGVLPIENSSTSDIHENIDHIFAHKDLEICGEAHAHIRLHLIGQKGAKVEEIKQVYSHGKAFEQCQKFLDGKDLEIIAVQSTAQAQKEVLERNDPTVVFIGGEILAKDSNLEILQKDISDEKENYTRFVFVRKKQGNNSKPAEKLTVIFQTKHEAGALAKVLIEIAVNQGDLQKIESRPIPGSRAEYSFWADIHTQGQSEILLQMLPERTTNFRLVGAYDIGQTFEI